MNAAVRNKSRIEVQPFQGASLLRESERLCRHTAENTTRPVAIHDDQGTVDFGSPSVEPLLGMHSACIPPRQEVPHRT